MSIIELRNEYVKDMHVQTLDGFVVQKAVLEAFPSGQAVLSLGSYRRALFYPAGHRYNRKMTSPGGSSEPEVLITGEQPQG